MVKHFRVWRRRWCAWREHPIADWAPICLSETGASALLEDGQVVPGIQIVVKEYRCVQHDQPR